MVDVAVISIGDELINGFTIDTNSAWIARNISKYNLLDVEDKIILKDDSNKIKSSIDFLLKKQYRFIFITGGLGPTHDDITKNTLKDYFDCDMVLNEEHFSTLKVRYAARIPLNLESIKNQSKILSISKAIPNDKGTALGMRIKHKKTDIFIIPGVPREVECMFNQYIAPLYIDPYYDKKNKYITILTTGIYETKLYSILKSIIDINRDRFKVSFLPKYTGVKVRISALDETGSLSFFRDEIVSKIKKYVYGYDNDSLEYIVANTLIDSALTLAIAESCTGGYLSKKMTDVPNSSKYFIGSVVAYSNQIKIKYLGVPESLLKTKGAVSREVALAMAENVRNKFNVDIGISTTGISGPSGGSIKNPIGRIYIAIVTQNDKIVKKFDLIPDRNYHRKIGVHVALNMLRLLLKI